MRISCSPTSEQAVYCTLSRPINSDFYAGERQAQQHVRKRARTASVTEQIGRDTAAAQQDHRCAGRTQRKKGAERQLQNRT